MLPLPPVPPFTPRTRLPDGDRGPATTPPAPPSKSEPELPEPRKFEEKPTVRIIN
jgi:hypothetical protein